MKFAAVVLMFVASFFVGGVLRIAHDTTPSAPVSKPTPSPTATPSPSHRPGVYPWESCSAHPNPSCPSPPPTACPKSVPRDLEPLYPNCLGRTQ